MRRVVVTGMGVVSCLGNDLETVSGSLRDSRAGIRFVPEYQELGLRSQVAGVPEIDLAAAIDRKLKRFMGDAAAYAYVAARDAIAAAGLDDAQVRSERTGLVAGSGGGSPEWQVETADLLRNRGVRKVGPYMVPRSMGSTVSATLSTAFGIRGVSYSLSAACATSAHCIGAGADLIRHGAQDIVIAGGGEELHWAMTAQFDAMGALSTKRNDTPATASRPYDADRDGFVIAGGGGMLVLEDYEHAVARGAPILAELVGYGVTSDGADMVAPSGEGAVRCMRMALEGARPRGRDRIDYLNTHGTSTPVGDVVELQAIREVFGDDVPPLSSTKALSG
ncbi:MAG: beta-ketoacyl-ACP synthase I, partial [Gammaproteobacteria bacterium]|nr:beta-ketoacyl-ACP synthase I [Gammaproteobacteria bacterium]